MTTRERIEAVRAKLARISSDIEREIAEHRPMQRVRMKPDFLGTVWVGDDEGTIDLSLLVGKLNWNTDGTG